MDHVEMHGTDEYKSSTIRKKSSLLKDDSYRIFYITKKHKENNDNNDHIDQTIDKKSSKMKNQNGLKKFLFLPKTPCELSLPDQTDESPSSVISTTIKLSNKNQLNIKREPKEDQTIVHNHLLTRKKDRFESTSRKSIFVNMHPEIQASVHRRRKRFIVACGTVLVALTIIITIIIYAIIMTINHKIQMSQSSFRNYPR